MLSSVVLSQYASALQRETTDRHISVQIKWALLQVKHCKRFNQHMKDCDGIQRANQHKRRHIVRPYYQIPTYLNNAELAIFFWKSWKLFCYCLRYSVAVPVNGFAHFYFLHACFEIGTEIMIAVDTLSVTDSFPAPRPLVDWLHGHIMLRTSKPLLPVWNYYG